MSKNKWLEFGFGLYLLCQRMIHLLPQCQLLDSKKSALEIYIVDGRKRLKCFDGCSKCDPVVDVAKARQPFLNHLDNTGLFLPKVNAPQTSPSPFI